jgi:hypothetical protein
MNHCFCSLVVRVPGYRFKGPELDYWRQCERNPKYPYPMSRMGIELRASRMVSFAMLRRVALVRTDVSEEHSAFFIRVTTIGELGTTLAATSNR